MIPRSPSVALATLCLLPIGASAEAATIAGPILNPANGHLYYLLDNNNWTNSQAEAVTLGGNLVTINDAGENAWVADTFSTFGGVQRNLWIGYTDESSEGTFVWVNGESPGYTNWNQFEPNNDASSGGEDHAVITPPDFSATGVWNDIANGLTGLHSVGGTRYANHGVVEVVVPEPQTIALIVAGSLALGRGAGRRR